MTKCCYNCKFYKHMGARGLGEWHIDDQVGNCRRLPPVFIPNEEEYDLSLANQELALWAQPVVLTTGWCGEWKEAKILPDQI